METLVSNARVVATVNYAIPHRAYPSSPHSCGVSVSASTVLIHVYVSSDIVMVWCATTRTCTYVYMYVCGHSIVKYCKYQHAG